MNQHDQMRNLAQKVVDCAEARAIKDWDCLHMYLSEAAQMARQALAAEPAPLVRLTTEEIFACFDKQNTGDDAQRNVLYFAHAVMAAMIAKNGGSNATD